MTDKSHPTDGKPPDAETALKRTVGAPVRTPNKSPKPKDDGAAPDAREPDPNNPASGDGRDPR